MKGKLLIAKSKRGQEGRRQLPYPKDLKATLEAQEALVAKGYLKKNLTLHPFCSEALSIVFEALELLIEFIFFIDIIMKNSSSEVSKSSSFTIFFDEDMKRDFYILKDRVQILCEDGKESTRLCEQLVAMKQEKEEILQRMHEMEMQLCWLEGS